MAAIDRLYLKNWHEFDKLVRWSICHYPELLNYMFNWRMTYKDWDDAMNESIKTKKEIIQPKFIAINNDTIIVISGITIIDRNKSCNTTIFIYNDISHNLTPFLTLSTNFSTKLPTVLSA